MSIIRVENLSTQFGNNMVHNNLNFEIHANEIFGILGGSGSGKTTLLQQLVMLNRVQKGSVFMLEHDISTLSLQQSLHLKQNFSYLFQFGALFSFLNVIENISVMLKEYTNLPSDLIEEIAYTHLNMVGLPTSCAKLYPAQLSGGMKKRAALARAIALQPKILFLDEPTSGLDPKSTQMFNELIIELKEVLNLTVVMITHDLDTITQVLDRFIILKESVIFNGTLAQAKQCHDDEVQNFLSQSH
jgi:phospholipid/cholesterol/gamma-HCH transport system ATP-binding protein